MAGIEENPTFSGVICGKLAFGDGNEEVKREEVGENSAHLPIAKQRSWQLCLHSINKQEGKIPQGDL